MNFHTRKWVKPEDLNPNGTLFGGSLLRWIDEEAAIYAIVQLGNQRVVTKYISEINFVSASRQGDIIELGITATEFGRTVRENGSGGTDHGHGSCLFVLGNSVDGGKVHGNFPGLSTAALYEGRDLPVTTDFRAVFCELAGKHLGVNGDHIAAVMDQPLWQRLRDESVAVPGRARLHAAEHRIAARHVGHARSGRRGLPDG